MTTIGAGLFLVATLVGQTAVETEPYVLIASSEGRVIQQKTSGPSAYTAELEIEIENNLSLPIDRLELEIRLQYEDTEIPGWRILRRFDRHEITAEGRSFLRIKRTLPAQRRNFALNKIQYRVDIVRYRLKRLRLDTVVRLIQSPFLSDQSAALVSLDFISSDPREKIRTQLAKEELDDFFVSKAIRPDPRVALELLIALRAIAALKIAEMIEPILVWYSLQNQEQWGINLIDLVQRVRRDSHSDERRLSIVPQWAKSTLSQDHRSNTVLRELLVSCVLSLSDLAIPQLVLTKFQSRNQTARQFASEILLLLGRQSAKEQFAMNDSGSLLHMIKVAEKINTRPYIDGIISLLASQDGDINRASKQALGRMSEQAIVPLVQTFTKSNAWSFREKSLLVEILRTKPPLRKVVAQEFGLEFIQDESLEIFISRLEERLKDTQDSKASESIRAAFQDFQAKHYEKSVRTLDSLLHSNPKLLRQKSEQITNVYLEYAEVLYDSGDYDQAKKLLSRVFLFAESQRAMILLEKTSLALAKGYLALGQHRRAYDELRELPSALAETHQLRELKTQILMAFLDTEISQSNFSRARSYIRHIETLGSSPSGLNRRKVLLIVLENLISVGVFLALLTGALLAVVIRVRSQFHRNKLASLQAQIDSRGNE